MSSYTHAEQILRSLGITEPEEIDIEAIAWYMGAIVRYQPLDGCEARILGRQERAIITVNSRSAKTRKRFSVAHELGHWRYHRGRMVFCAAGDIESGNKKRALDEERVADRFGADLLMPRYLVMPALGKVEHLSWNLVNRMARLFATSPVATAIRLVDLNLVPSLVICHRQSGRAWFARAQDVPDRWFPSEVLGSDSIAFDLLYGGHGNQKASHVPAYAWFDRPDADRYELLEESIGTQTGEVLSLLTVTDERMLEDF